MHRLSAFFVSLGVVLVMALGSPALAQAPAAGTDPEAATRRGHELLQTDPVSARAHFRYAADQGNPAAQWNLGMMLLEGEGGPADAVEARRYVKMAAEAGYVQGQISMAVMLALGQGGPVDEPAAREWYLKAADQGSAHAMRGLGMMLMIAQGGPADTVLGWALLELAAEAGDGNAVKLIGIILEQGFKPEREAVDELKREIVAIVGEPWL